MSPAVSLLTIPGSLRRRIYHEAGLVTNTSINLNPQAPSEQIESDPMNQFKADKFRDGYYEPDSLEQRKEDREHNFPGRFPLYHALIQVCREVYLEVSSMVFSENLFTIRYKGPEGLEALRMMSRRNLASLKRLTISWVVTTCWYRYHWCRVVGARHLCSVQGRRPGYGNQPCTPADALDMSSSYGASIMKDLRSTIARLAECIKPHQLELHFICDVKDMKTAESISEAFAYMPILKSCSIRLSQKQDRTLQSLAEEISLKATDD